MLSGKTRWQVALDLLYGQVKKAYRRRQRVERRMRLGDPACLTNWLKGVFRHPQHRFCRVHQSDPAACPGCPILSLLGHRTTHWRIARPSGVVASVLPFLPSALGAAPAARAAGQADATPVWTTHAGHGGRSHGSPLVRGEVVSVPRGSMT